MTLIGDDPGLWPSQVDRQMPMEDLMGAYIRVYMAIGLKHGARVGKDINLELKGFVLDIFATMFERAVTTYLYKYGLKKVITVRQSFIDEIVSMITEKNELGWSVARITDAVQQAAREPNFYRWQAERIARTESTAASNFGALKAGDASGYVMQKVWISGHDSRTRRKPNDQYDHREMDGKRVERTEPFEFTSTQGEMDQVQFPGDPEGRPGNIINCRCSIAMMPKKDKNGKLIRI